MFEASAVFEANYTATDEVVVNQGGSSSGKTYSILQVLFLRAIENPHCVITVVGETIPNLKSGALRDAQNIVSSSKELQRLIASYNATDRVYTLYNGSLIEFKSYETSQSAKSGKRDFLFINEANGISFEVYTELNLRTRKQTFIDYNPNSEFWVHEKVIGQPGTKLLISDHRHNPYLSQKTRDKIEALKDIDLELWKVYARGMTGRIEGLVFRNWQVVDGIDRSQAKFIAVGLDWGFTNDPTAVIAVFMQGGELWIEELVYERGLTNQDIAAKLRELGITRSWEIIADSAEPKSIEEVYRMGFNIHPTSKGPDSIRTSIDVLKRYKMNITRSSVNLIRELNQYKWKADKNGNPTGEPVDFMNHCFVGSTMVATIGGQKRIDQIKAGEYVYTSKGPRKVLKRWDNGKKQIATYLIQCDTFSLSLTCTDNHLIKTTQGWKPISKLQPGMRVFLHSSLMEARTTDIMENAILQKAEKNCIELFGNISKAQYQKGTMFTMWTAIQQTMILATLILLRLLCICDMKAKSAINKILSGLKNFIQKESKPPKTGIKAKRVENGTKNTVEKAGLISHTKLYAANNAAKNIKRESQVAQSFVIKTVKRKRLEQEELVYDLMVEDCHEYYANGLLVHNCVDACRYVALKKLIHNNSGRYVII